MTAHHQHLERHHDDQHEAHNRHAHQEGHHDTSMTLEVVNGWLANATGERPARYAVYHPEVLGPGVLPDAQE
jgi:hypothetical protein